MSDIRDIAKEAGVSKSTVSRVLNNNGPVNHSTRKRIEEAMATLNYSPNVFAQGMRSNRSRSIGILYPDLSNPFFPEWYKTIEKISRAKGYMNYICVTDPEGKSEDKTIKDLLGRRIDGLIYFSFALRPEIHKKLRLISKEIPVVFCDPTPEYSSDDNYITSNGYSGTCEAVKFLIKQGRRKIAYIRGEKKFAVTTDRLKGYMACLNDSGFEINEEYIVEGYFHQMGGYEAAKQLMELVPRPDAILAANDIMALGVLRYLKDAKVNVPQDVAVIGFDNISLSAISDPPLTTIALPIVEMASLTIDYLINKIENKTIEPIHEILDCKLILRESTLSPINEI